MKFFGGPADRKELHVPEGHHVFRVETNDGYGDGIEYALYRIRRWERQDGSLVDIMVTEGVADSHIRRYMT